MKKIQRHSIEHFAQVREIDMRYNAVLDKAKKQFERTHKPFDPECPEWREWREIFDDIEEQRHHEFSVLRARLIDPE